MFLTVKKKKEKQLFKIVLQYLSILYSGLVLITVCFIRAVVYCLGFFIGNVIK